MSSKCLQTWTLIHSVMRRPQYDGSAAGCQDCPCTLSGSDRAHQEQTVCFKGNHCFNEIVFFVCRYLTVMNQFVHVFLLLYERFIYQRKHKTVNYVSAFSFCVCAVWIHTHTYEMADMVTKMVTWCCKNDVLFPSTQYSIQACEKESFGSVGKKSKNNSFFLASLQKLD